MACYNTICARMRPNCDRWCEESINPKVGYCDFCNQPVRINDARVQIGETLLHTSCVENSSGREILELLGAEFQENEKGEHDE